MNPHRRLFLAQNPRLLALGVLQAVLAIEACHQRIKRASYLLKVTGSKDVVALLTGQPTVRLLIVFRS